MLLLRNSHKTEGSGSAGITLPLCNDLFPSHLQQMNKMLFTPLYPWFKLRSKSASQLVENQMEADLLHMHTCKAMAYKTWDGRRGLDSSSITHAQVSPL